MAPGTGLPGAGLAPPSRSSGTGVIVGIIVGGGFIVLLVVAIALAATGVFSGSPLDTPVGRIRAAAQSLSAARAVKLDGTFTSGADRLEGDLRVTRGGRAMGDLTWNGEEADLLVADDTMYVKAGAEFWRSENPISLSGTAQTDPDRWGKLSFHTLSLDIRSELKPSALADRMRRVGDYGIRDSAETTYKGRRALKITTSNGRFYVSSGDDPKLLRIEQTYPRIHADVTEETNAQATPTIDDLRTRVRQLKDSYDNSQLPRAEEVKFGSCGGSGCTLRSRVWSTRGSAASVRIEVRMWLTATTRTGRKLGECTTTATVDSIKSVWASCRVTDRAWKSFHSGSGYRKWWAHTRPTVLGASPSDIQRMLDGIDSE